MANNNDEINKQTEKELADEAKKYGFGSVDEGENKHLNLDDDEDDEETDDKGDLDDEEADEEDESDSDESDEEDGDDEDSDDDSEDDDDSDEDEEEDDDEDEEDDSPRKKKVIPFKKYNQTRKDLRQALKDLATLKDSNEELQAKLPDDYQDRVDALIKEIGVQDPESLKKILDFTKSVVDQTAKKNEERLSKLESQLAESRPIVDEFTTEWPSFKDKSFVKAFPNATAEQTKEAEKLMDKLAHDKKTGGKLYVDQKTGKTLLDPYELDYIFFKNKNQFEAIVTGKKVKGMESARTQGVTVDKDTGEKKIKKLSKDSSAKDIREMDRMYSQEESGMGNLRSPENNSI